MRAGRVRCVVALLTIAACSFPSYSLPSDSGTGTSGSPSCANDLRDGEEVGVDCGGPSCNPCAACSDGKQNGGETGVDCGGSCPACPSCTDGVQNGSESDRDCGGSCPRCAADGRCRQSSDCASLVCLSVCQPSDCMDGVRNGLETGLDCGGGSCLGCRNSAACKVDGDCQSLRCQNEVCVDAGCTDGLLNGQESDTDCGGPECAPCATDQHCALDRDCRSHICPANQQCAEASCGDAVQNQTETDIDCGGRECAPCEPARGCRTAADCASELCQSGICVPESPAGQPLSRAGWSLQTSETTTEQNPQSAIDGDLNSCWTSGRPQYVGMFVELDLAAPRYFFKARMVVETPPFDQDVPTRVDVYVSNDGFFGDPVMTVQGYRWTWMDFPAAQVGRYVRFVLAEGAPRSWSIGDITLYD